MAEFCRECFINDLLDDKDRLLLKQGKLEITMYTDCNDLCEGCEKFKPCVNYVEYE